MKHDPKLDELRGIALFDGLRTRELREVSRMCMDLDRPVGTALTKQDHFGHECFVILDGSVDVIVDGEVIVTRGRGDVVGEVALLDGIRRTATAVAATPVRMLVMSTQEFFSLLSRFPSVAARVASNTGDRDAAPVAVGAR